MGSTNKQTKSVERGTSLLSASAAVSPMVELPRKLSNDLNCPAQDLDRTTQTMDTNSRSNSDMSDWESDSVSGSTVDGVSDSECLKYSDVLTQCEVIKRRKMHVDKLRKHYLSQYWLLFEEMRIKHQRYYLKTGRGGWRDDAEAQSKDVGEGAEEAGQDGLKEPKRENTEILHCKAQDCMTKPLPLTTFCFQHILLDPRQRLYKSCSYICLKAHNEIKCGTPVLQSAGASLCRKHFQLTQRQVNGPPKKAVPEGLETAPKAHLIFSHYVQVIQSKRRKMEVKALKAAQFRGEPSVKEPSVKVPSVKEPCIKESSVKEPCVKESNVKDPSVREVSVSAPSEN